MLPILPLIHSLLFVLPLNLLSCTKISKTRSSWDDNIIKRRIFLVCIECLISFTLNSLFIPNVLQGILIFNLLDIIKAIILTLILFIGPLAFIHESYNHVDGVWPAVKTYVVGPIAEELIFRLAIIDCFLLYGYSFMSIIFISPIYFGAAHIHHAWELVQHGTPFLPAVMISLFQFLFTTIFGWYTSFLYLRTGSVWPCIAVHCLCNKLGLPPIVTGTKAFIYYPMIGIGLIGFFKLLLPLTASPNQILA